ncbi:hypothetical protein SAMN05216344_11056 [Polaromonas sp. OV174]|uniref:DUF6600 domain-containing protein n=1 Tax=Polaromonas sp. OV174 TaxID=1855300 RepID=UPI0008E745D6|nr:DUF6600 domain-containing protein [Polaromonas sp. OV174]SFC15996.1 hypothetical protein SAMN05216344_11056 [Polaromonas sp. OV174]
MTTPSTTGSSRQPRRLLRFYGCSVLLLALFQPVAWAQQGANLDPPGSVARLNLTQGAVSFSPADSAGATTNAGWRSAELNRPLTSGDRLWSGPRARAELHVGSTAVRLNQQTSLDLVALDDTLTQLNLAQGTVALRVRALYEGQRLEIDTSNLAFVIAEPGSYRLDVDPASHTTRVVVQSGSGVIYGDNGNSLTLGPQQQVSFTGTQLIPAAPGADRQDDFDVWVASRDQQEDQSVSARYIPREIIGYQQLDAYGDWQQDPSYGAIWLPRSVPLHWAPYSVGNWSWISPWGWTWIDDAPWGFAPFHYGRWAQIGPRWAWVPGRLAPRPVYAPALVAFVGAGAGLSWNIAIGSGSASRPGVGWFPLAPGEAFRPAYRSSPRYLSQVNNNIVINQLPNQRPSYRYQRQPTAVTAVSRDDFVRGQPVRGNPRPLSAAELSKAQVVVERNALPQRPERGAGREPSRPAAALPPAAMIARPLLENRVGRPAERRDTQPQERSSIGPQAQTPRSAARRDSGAREVEQRALQQDQQRQQNESVQRQRALNEQAQRAQQAQQEQQRRQNEEALGQRALREQAQRQQEQARQQQQQRVQQEQQRRQNEEALGQRALREQAQRQQEQARQQQVQQQQQQQQQQEQQHVQQEQQRQAREQQRQHTEQLRQQEQQRRQNEEALGQRALREQAQRQQEQARQQQQIQQQQQRAQQERQQQLDRRSEPAQERPRMQRPDTANPERPARPEGEPGSRRREP